MWWHYSEPILILPFPVINKTWPESLLRECASAFVCVIVDLSPQLVAWRKGGRIEEENGDENCLLRRKQSEEMGPLKGGALGMGCKTHRKLEQTDRSQDEDKGRLRKRRGRKSERRKKAGGRELRIQKMREWGKSGSCFIICRGIVRWPVNSQWTSPGRNFSITSPGINTIPSHKIKHAVGRLSLQLLWRHSSF